VIDTDEKLTAWVNQTSGNDYSFVVIKGERNLYYQDLLLPILNY